MSAGLFAVTAVCEIVGCYLPWLWLNTRAGAWALAPAALALVAFVWLLTLHPHAVGRTYAAYGCVYVAVALVWLWQVDGVIPDRRDLIGAGLALVGMAVITRGPRPT